MINKQLTVIIIILFKVNVYLRMVVCIWNLIQREGNVIVTVIVTVIVSDKCVHWENVSVRRTEQKNNKY